MNRAAVVWPGVLFILVVGLYAIYVRFGPWLKLKYNRHLVRLVINDKNFKACECFVALIEPEGPDVACVGVCGLAVGCDEYWEKLRA